MRRWVPRLAWPVLVSVAFVGVLFVAVFPTQTYLGQRSEVEEKRAELARIEATNEQLEARTEELDDSGHVELLAREQFGLVRPGEEAYALPEPPVEPVDVPSVWPFDRLERRLEGCEESPIACRP